MRILTHYSKPSNIPLIQDIEKRIECAPFYVTIHNDNKELYTVIFYTVNREDLKGKHTNELLCNTWYPYNCDNQNASVYTQAFQCYADHADTINACFSNDFCKRFILKCNNNTFHVYQKSSVPRAATYQLHVARLLAESHHRIHTVLVPIMSYIAYDLDAIIIHASAGAYADNAFLFLGYSGGGKSTAANMLCRGSEGIQHIADDRVFLKRIFPKEGNVVFNVMDSKKFIQYSSADTHPRTVTISPVKKLKAIFVLKKTKNPYVKPVQFKTADELRTLLEMTEIFGNVADRGNKIVKHAYLLFRECINTTPTYELGFDKETTFWPLLAPFTA